MSERITGWRRTVSMLAFGATALSAAGVGGYELGTRGSDAQATLDWIYNNCSSGRVDAFPGPGPVFKLSPNAFHGLLDINQAESPRTQLQQLTKINEPLEKALTTPYKQVDMKLVTNGPGSFQPDQYSDSQQLQLEQFQSVITTLATDAKGSGVAGATAELSGGGGSITAAEVEVFQNPQVCNSI
jgi:hypothetical protein